MKKVNDMLREKRSYNELKQSNRNRIYRWIYEQKSVSRQDLVFELQLSLPTVTQNLLQLMEEGLIEENGSFGNTGGRRARAYQITPEARVSIGLDITRNHITLVVVNLNGQIIYRVRVRHRFSLTDEYFKKLGDMVEEAVLKLTLKTGQILGVGIAVPGLISEDGRTVFYGAILDFEGTTCEELGKYILYPCHLYNDADAAGYAEACMTQKNEDSFYISLSNNIGGSILINRQVYKGEGPRSGEVGHITIVPDGRECYCGHRGCFEAYCNATLLSEQSDGDLEKFFNRLKNGDASCLLAWEEYVKYLVIAVNNVRMLFDCKVILGGYVGAYLDEYMDEIRQKAVERNPFENSGAYLQVCQVKKDALAAGGALPFVIEFMDNV